MAESARATLERYRSDPVAFCREVLHFFAWSKQCEILESVRDHPRTAVRSAHGPGKTATAARAALWFLSVHEGAKVITTAAGATQVRHQFWREIARAYNASGGWIGGELYHTRLELSKDWFAVGFTTDKTERFAGWHAEHLLLVVDEASGVPEEIFEAAAGIGTTPGSRLLLIGNPTKTSGTFFAAFHSNRALYNTIHISAFDCPAFTGEDVPPEVLDALPSKTWVEGLAELWGEHDPRYQVRVLAEFPSQEEFSIMGLADLEAAQARIIEPGPPYMIACDVARFGSDSTVVAERRGDVARIKTVYRGKDTMRTVGEISRAARALQADVGRKPKVIVDDAGLGGGVVDRLRELGEFEILAFNGASATRSREYPRKRDEAWFTLSERLSDIDIPKDEELAADLLAPRYFIDSNGRRVVEPKSETKKRLRRSPDRGDAIVMLFGMDRRYRPARTSSLRQILAKR